MRGLLAILALAALLLAVGMAGGSVHAADPPPMSSVLADKILVIKSQRKLYLLKGERVLRTYNVALGSAPLGHKTTEWDGKTPEGKYTVDLKNPHSRFHLSLRISYPNAADTAQATARGVKAGDEIFIHGQGAFAGMKLRQDWTQGCIAVTNAEIREIWSFVKKGTTIEIRP